MQRASLLPRFGAREVVVAAGALVAALALALAAVVGGEDPEALARAALARERAAATGAGLASWAALREQDALLHERERLAWPLEGAATEPAPRERAAAATPEQRAFDALAEAAVRAAARNPAEARALLADATALAERVDVGPDRAAWLALQAVRVAAADSHTRPETAVALLRELLAEADGAHVEDGLPVELAGLLAIAYRLPAAEREDAAAAVATRWAAGRLALPAPLGGPAPAGSPSDELEAVPLRAALLDALVRSLGPAAAAELAPALTRREALARGAALVSAEALPRAEVGPALRVVPAHGTGADTLVALRRVRATDRGDADLLEGVTTSLAALTRALVDAARADGLLAADLDLALVPAASEEAAGGTAVPGTPLVLLARHADPAAFEAGVAARARRLRRLLLGVAALVAAGGLATATMLARSRALVRARTAFVASVSHELRTPLATILLMAENLEAGRVRDPARRAEYHGALRREAARLRRLVEDVLDLARAERGDPPLLSPSWVALEAFAPELERALSARAAARGGTLRFEAHELAHGAWLDADAVTRAAANLVENAVLHGGTDAPVEVRVDGDARGADGRPALRLTVRDRGPGLSRAARVRAFEPFVRLAARTDAPGVGLGLAIVRELARAHGGDVRLLAPPDGPGTLAELELPRGTAPDEVGAPPAPSRLRVVRPTGTDAAHARAEDQA